MKTINRIAYFLDDHLNFFIIYIIIVGTPLIIMLNSMRDENLSQITVTSISVGMLIFIACVFLMPLAVYFKADEIVDEDLEKSITRTEFKVTAYKNKNLLVNYPEEIYYLIKIENETKIVREDLVFLNKQDKFADSEHKAGTTDIEYIEIKLDDGLPAYKREIFNQKTKYKNRLNIINYVSTEV